MRGLLLAVFVLGISNSVQAADANQFEAQGSGALALASLVGQRDPALWSDSRTVIKSMGNGNIRGGAPIRVRADDVTCRAGNVDITRHSCALTFGKKIMPLEGRAAHELYATLLEVGVEPDGAAGSVYAQIRKLDCTVEPRVIAEKSGGGARCTWKGD